MTIQEVIRAAGTTKTFRRKAWTHNDRLYVMKFPSNAYGSGELKWEMGDVRTQIVYIDELLADDWELVE